MQLNLRYLTSITVCSPTSNVRAPIPQHPLPDPYTPHTCIYTKFMYIPQLTPAHNTGTLLTSQPLTSLSPYFNHLSPLQSFDDDCRDHANKHPQNVKATINHTNICQTFLSPNLTSLVRQEQLASLVIVPAVLAFVPVVPLALTMSHR